MLKITVAIITFNEENNIARCIESVLPIADEILVVDSFSTDKTESICLSYGVRFIKNPFKGHIEQKNYALDQATFPYVLSLDADEALSPLLLEEIKKIKASELPAHGYRFNRLNNYCGQWIYHSGWYPDTKLRLIKKDAARWGGENPHDVLIMNNGNTTSFLNGDLLHYTYKTVSEHITQTNKFTTIAAHVAFNKGKSSGLMKICTRPFLTFFKDYILKKGFLDGYYGLIICSINSLSNFLKYTKIYELKRNQKI